MIEELTAEFARRFGRQPAAGAAAPGRVNWIGEHTDYNEGLVLPFAVDLRTAVLLAPRSDGRVRGWSRELGEAPEQGAAEASPARRAGTWIDYVQGVAWALRERGLEPGGFDVAVASEVPAGSGLSSSAALELAVVTALDAALAFGLDATARARVAHRAESGFVGVACGIMDPFASALGREGHLLRLDCRSEEVEHVPLPAARLRLLVAHSGAARELATAAYGERVAECRRALEAARVAGVAAPEARSLRDLGCEDLPALERVLEPTLLARVRHVVTENERVDASCAALRAGDLERAGELLREGMRSLRDDYAVSTERLDLLCREADALPGVYGSRLTGAGFGGCTLHLVDAEAAPELARRLPAALEARGAGRPPVWIVEPAPGAAALRLGAG